MEVYVRGNKAYVADDRWVTIGGKDNDGSGQHVKINGEGTITAGFGKGKNVKNAFGGKKVSKFSVKVNHDLDEKAKRYGELEEKRVNTLIKMEHRSDAKRRLNAYFARKAREAGKGTEEYEKYKRMALKVRDLSDDKLDQLSNKIARLERQKSGTGTNYYEYRDHERALQGIVRAKKNKYESGSVGKLESAMKEVERLNNAKNAELDKENARQEKDRRLYEAYKEQASWNGKSSSDVKKVFNRISNRDDKIDKLKRKYDRDIYYAEGDVRRYGSEAKKYNALKKVLERAGKK